MTKKELERYLAEEKKLYVGTDAKKLRRARYSAGIRYRIWRYLYYFRLAQYYNERRVVPSLGRAERDSARLMFRYYDRRRNLCGERAGLEIALSSRVGICPDIWHAGVVINGEVGDRCVFHGSNTVGNKGRAGHDARPNIGCGVDIGAGAIIIGSVTVPDGCVIGAGAVVTRSFDEENSIIAGVPAKVIGKKTEADHG